MSVNLFPDLSRFAFYNSPLFIVFFILFVYSLNTVLSNMMSFVIVFFTFLISFALYWFCGTFILRDKEPSFQDTFAIFESIPFTSTILLLITLSLYSITTGFINNKSSILFENADSTTCSSYANLFLLLLFVFLLLNDFLNHIKRGRPEQLTQTDMFKFSFLLLIFGILLPVSIYMIVMMLTRDKTYLFLYNFQNYVCSNTPNMLGPSNEYYCKQEENPTVIVQ